MSSSIFESVRDGIISNRHKRLEGKDVVIPFTNFPKLSTVYPGIKKSTYICVTAAPKVGKTMITDSLFVFEPLTFIQNNPHTNIRLQVFYFSLEMSKQAKITQMISNRIFKQRGKIISPDHLNSFFKGYILDQDIAIDLHTKDYTDWFNFIESKVTYIDNIRTASGIFSYMFQIAKSNGKFFKDKIITHSPEKTGWDTYIEDDPDLFTLVITDHVGLLQEEHNYPTIKSCIDLHSSRYALTMRDQFKYTVIDVHQQSLDVEHQQYTRDGKSIISKVKPKHDGLGESKITSRNINIMFGLFAPVRYDIPEYHEYDILTMKDHYRELSILLNRDGGNRIELDLYFHGAINYFCEIPTLKEEPNLYKKLNLK